MNRRLAVIIFALIGIQGCDGQTAGQVAALGALAQSGFEKRAADQPLTQAEQAAISEIKSHKQEARHVDLPLAAIPPLLIAAAQAFQTGGSGGADSGSDGTGSGATPAPCINTTVVSTGSNRTGPPILPREASSRDLAITDCQTE
ncbi:MAG: hypothetical protein H7338_03805, partial [Candidatus Sericytochromatia bacterium]|nr:hypothetical protein [Candidatus Sericytochromatia bacterium]